MLRFPLSQRARTLLGLGLLLPAFYLILSLRKVEAEGSTAVLDSPIFPLSPRRVDPGWRLVPPGLLRLSVYPESPARFVFDLPGVEEGRLSTSEGIGVQIRGQLSYRVPPETVLSLHRTARGEVARRVLKPSVEKALFPIVRESSYARISGGHRPDLECNLSTRLGPLLRKTGVLFLAVKVDNVRVAGSVGGRRSLRPIKGARLLVVGLDGADWRVMDPLLIQGRLPNLARLIQGGVRSKLRTIVPTLSPVVWTTVATGFLPAEHGILDFLVTDTRTGRKVPVTNRHRKVRAVWELLNEARIRVGVVGWWATWPAEPVEGYIVSDRVAYQLFGQERMGDPNPAGKTYPGDLFQRIAPLVVSPQQITDSDLGGFVQMGGGGDEAWSSAAETRLDEFRTVLAAARTYESITLALASAELPAFEAVYFEGIDTTSHLFMPFRPPRRESVSMQDFRRFSGTVDAFYVYQDQVLGRILEKAGDQTSVLVLSDHGFHSQRDRPAGDSRIGYSTAAAWHRKYGILVASGRPFRRGVTLTETSVVDITPTILAFFGLPVGEDMQGRPIQELFTPDFLSEHPISYRPSWEGGSRGKVPEADDPAGDRALREKLLALGYLSQAGSLTSNNLGNTLLAQGDVEGAVREFAKAVRENPQLAVPRINLGRAHLARRDLASARRVLEEAIRISPESADALVLLGSVDREEGLPDRAEGRLRAALAMDPSSSEAHKGLGLLFRQQGDPDRAEREYDLALQIDPDDPEAYNNLGVIRKEQGRLEEAEVEFRKAIDADPRFSGSYNNLALIAMDRQDWEPAEELLREALERNSGDPMIHNNLGNLLFRRNRLDEADREYRKAIELRKSYAEPHNGLGAILGRRGNEEAEIAEYRKALDLDRNYLDARMNLGEALQRRGRMREAEEEFRQVLSLSPGHLGAASSLVRHLLESGRAAEAVTVARQACRLKPELALPWNLLGEAALAAGDRRSAAEAFRNSLEREPNQNGVQERLKVLERSR